MSTHLYIWFLLCYTLLHFSPFLSLSLSLSLFFLSLSPFPCLLFFLSLSAPFFLSFSLARALSLNLTLSLSESLSHACWVFSFHTPLPPSLFPSFFCTKLVGGTFLFSISFWLSLHLPIHSYIGPASFSFWCISCNKTFSLTYIRTHLHNTHTHIHTITHTHMHTHIQAGLWGAIALDPVLVFVIRQRPWRSIAPSLPS